MPVKAAPPDIDALIGRCRNGEQTAFAELFRHFRSDIRRILVSAVGPDPELDDLVQTAALEMFRSLPRFEGRSKFTSWLYRLTVNVALHHLRQRTRRALMLDLTAIPERETAITDNPEAALIRKGELQAVREALDALAPKKRIVFVLHEVEGLLPEEIAEIVGASQLTVKSRLFYARKEFFKRLRQRAMLDEAKTVASGSGK
ncbi:MAG: sigma-70 family RNA polymerase sigma factor [Myxococcales bacterium]|nr:MAG: sigma-70 family RNA polymerase sigma factor [Myxococcales bacterium]